MDEDRAVMTPGEDAAETAEPVSLVEESEIQEGMELNTINIDCVDGSDTGLSKPQQVASDAAVGNEPVALGTSRALSVL